MIKAFLSKYEHREYLRLLFSKIFDEATDLRKYLEPRKAKIAPQTATAPLPLDGLHLDQLEEEAAASNSLYSPIAHFIPDHFGGSFSLELKRMCSSPIQNSPTEDSKLA
jgi:hypothetical protein